MLLRLGGRFEGWPGREFEEFVGNWKDGIGVLRGEGGGGLEKVSNSRRRSWDMLCGDMVAEKDELRIEGAPGACHKIR